jgi:hypothetical protein
MTLTTDVIPVASVSNTLVDSHLDDGLTTPGVITSSEPVTVNDHMSIGAGTALDANTIVNIRETSTDATVTGMQVIVTHNPTVAATGTETAYLELDANYDSQSSDAAPILLDCEAFVHSNTQRLASLSAAYFLCDLDGSANAGELAPVVIEPFKSGTGTVDQLNALHILSVFGGANVTENCGIRIDDQITGNDHAILTGKGLVEFGDDLKVNGKITSTKTPIGLVLLESLTASNSATLDLTNWYSTDYDSIEIVISELIPVVGTGVGLILEVSTNGGVSWDTAAHYQFSDNWYGVGYADQGYSAFTGNTNFRVWGGSTGDNWIGALNSKITLMGVTSATVSGKIDSVAVFNGRGFYNLVYGIAYNASGPVNALRFVATSGNLSSGTIRIYGYAN